MKHFTEISLNPEERGLILRYGYPDPDLREEIETLKGKRSEARIKVASSMFNVLIGDLCHSLRTKVRDEFTAEELDALITKLELEAVRDS